MNISNFLFIFLICFFKMTDALSPVRIDYFVIFNVGQGLWTSHVTNDYCDHYDFGGELYNSKKLKSLFFKLCASKKNRLNLSHADVDHYSFINLIIQNSKSVCWQTQAIDQLTSKLITKPTDKSRRNTYSEIPTCKNNVLNTKIMFYSSEGPRKNDRSIVQIVDDILIPGDSTQKMERIWSPQNKENLYPVRILMLGHHGSHTSTGVELLNQLTNLKMAVASARYERYKHPSQETIARLKKYKVPLVRTEDWGNIATF